MIFNKHSMKLILTTYIICMFSTLSFAQEKEENMDEMWGSDTVSVEVLIAGKGKLFDQSNFGMFIHWGLFSNLAGEWKGKTYYGIGEWLMNPRMANIPPKDYMEVAKDFNPKNFDAKKIAQLAKDAGMKYIIITSKHHEGFAMFDSEASPFNIVDATPFARDPMKELAKACHDLDLGFGFYYSHNQDWTSPGAKGGPTTNDNGEVATFESYFYEKCLPQIKEICSNYGAIDFVWFDTPGNMKKELVKEVVEVVRDLQPNAMLCSRVGHGMGDYSSKGDMEVPVRNMEGLWETCDTNNDSWSYAWYDNNFKSPKKIIERLVSTVARGGTYLFNIGPNGQGEIPEIGAQFLRETGLWIQSYPQVIYDAGSSPWGTALAWGDVTTQGTSLFLTVYNWPEDGLLYLPGLQTKIESANLLDGAHKSDIEYTQNDQWTVFKIPFQSPEKNTAVIEITTKVKATDVDVNTNLGVYPNCETLLLAELSTVENATQEDIRWMEKFGEWKHANQVSRWEDNSRVSWEVNVQKAGYYYAELNYKGRGRLVWKTETDEGVMIQNQQAATEKYVFYNMGILEFKTPGKHTISVSLVEGNKNSSSLKGLLLKPIP
jgi:alpha-L-fucosidase